MIIGISGYIGSGKDTVAKIIQYLDSKSQGYKGTYIEWELTSDRELYPTRWQIKKFAYKLKQMVSILTGISVEDLEKQEVKSSKLGEEWNKITVRELLQTIGTELVRNGINQNAWVNALFADYKKVPQSARLEEREYPNWLITDVRFENEVQAIKERDGIVIRVSRASPQDDLPVKRHSSETSLDDYKFDYVIQNFGTMEDLLEEVKGFLKQCKLWEGS